MTTAARALERLVQGNARFLATVRADAAESSSALQPDGQSPFAAVLCCSDSRVPPELIFSQGFGDLFVIRVAGNIVTSSVLGSVDFAVGVLGTSLVVVLGHTGCGAVAATVDAIGKPEHGTVSENVGAIIESIRPAVESVVAENEGSVTGDLLTRAVAVNVGVSTRRLLVGSAELSEGVAAGTVAVVGGIYSLETGAVEFLDPGLPDASP